MVTSCLSSMFRNRTPIYVGGLTERSLSFTPAINHTGTRGSYFDQACGYKYAGNVSVDWAKDYNWLRNPHNLFIAFNTAKTVGLEKIISKEKYFAAEDQFYDGQWEDKSPNEIIKSYLQSDTSKTASDDTYFNEFWTRRRKEGNVNELYTILKQIDAYYNNGIKSDIGQVNDTMKALMDFDYQMKSVDQAGYKETLYQNINYLKKIGLEHSAYDLINFQYTAGRYEVDINRDSLNASFQLDTISYQVWWDTRLNSGGWIDYSHFEGP